jgi:hypothetical protein
MQPEGRATVGPEELSLTGLPEPQDLELVDSLLREMLVKTQAELERLARSHP